MTVFHKILQCQFQKISLAVLEFFNVYRQIDRANVISNQQGCENTKTAYRKATGSIIRSHIIGNTSMLCV
jgi:hypothetical protein